MQLNKIQKLLRKNKEVFRALEEYDRTRELLVGRKRIYITLNKKTIKKLKEEKERSGKPISRIIEDALEKFF